MKKLDKFLNKVLPKKFIVLIGAFIVVLCGFKPPTEFWILCITYLTGNAVTKFSKNNNNHDDDTFA